MTRSRSFLAFSLSIAAAAFLGACDQHTWEETSKLQEKHGSHRGEDHAGQAGDAAHASQEKEAAHEEKAAEH